MRAEPGIGAGTGVAGRVLVASALALGAWGSVARAQTGFMQVQYERLQSQSLTLIGDSTLVTSSTVVSYWTQNYQLNRAMTLGSTSRLTWQLGFQDRQAVDRLERTQTPYGNLRLALPTSGLYASVRPVTTTTRQQLGTLPGGSIGGIADTTVRQYVTQSVLTAYVAQPRLPRLDVSWIRDQRGGPGSGPGAASRFNDRRDARLAHTLGVLALRANYGDLARGDEALKTSPSQRNYGAGAGVSLAPRVGMSVRLDYDYASFDRRAARGLATDTRTHRASLTGNWAESRTLSWNLYSWYQRSVQPFLGRGAQDNGEGQLVLAWQPGRAFRAQTGAQVRRVAQGTATGIERIVLGTAAVSGDLRPGWHGIADFAQSLTWSPFRSLFGVTTAHAGSRMRLQQGIDLTLDAQAAVNNDSTATARAVGQGSAGLVMVPLRTITTTLRGSFYRVGSSFTDPANTSRTGEVDLRWTPLQSLDLSGNLRTQVGGPIVVSHSSTRTAYVRWRPGTMVQLNLNYSRTRFEDPRLTAGPIVQPDREIVSVQGTWSIDRMKQITGEASVLDPDRPTRTNAYNTSFTWRFGR